MESFFSLKIDIPDINDIKVQFSYFDIFGKKKRLIFLFTCETNVKEIKIVDKINKIYKIGEITKSDKAFSLYI